MQHKEVMRVADDFAIEAIYHHLDLMFDFIREVHSAISLSWSTK